MWTGPEFCNHKSHKSNFNQIQTWFVYYGKKPLCKNLYTLGKRNLKSEHRNQILTIFVNLGT